MERGVDGKKRRFLDLQMTTEPPNVLPLANTVTADYSLTISNTISSAIGKWRVFGRFVRNIMRHIRHDKHNPRRNTFYQQRWAAKAIVVDKKYFGEDYVS